MDEGHPGITLTTGSLLLRPWRPDDAPALLAAHADPAMRHWLATRVSSADEAAEWLAEQREGWAAGTRFGFAVTDTDGGGELVGNLALKRPGPASDTAEVGYWTTAAARGRGVAPRALAALCDWAFASFAPSTGAGLAHLELLHQVDNEASCRVAEKCGFPLTGILPASPPDYPLDGHRHVRSVTA
ncbi:GNAT family N-acetyltransferase [Streptomyces finlayi]|uniref:GNAT family N-acetyltransferase n=1 Tax=Streptomyces finlayi TaxID=67296 RepID=A0A7G7BNW9_9ACTN|nr:GNAT family N-acetyltransferase [Streptomyces finlayi]QNE77034.1 GNAT family N-acetyltransferase [Streptomyces finlayi]